jgi:phage N-6-adenine-methyltransferase
MNEVVRLIRGDSDAEKIGALYAKARRSLTDSLRYLIEAGQALRIKKKSMQYGEWLPWLKVNADVLGFESERTAQRLLRMGKYDASVVFDESEAAELLRNFWGHDGRTVKPYTGDDEWYTPAEYIERVRRVLGGIDLDPASNERAQQIVQAGTFFTKADDALMQDWHGRVWLNPPYSKGLLYQFVSKMIHEVKSKRTTAAIMLLNNFTDADWFQLACSICAAICFPRGRIYFKNASGKIDRPLNGQAFFYYGGNVDSFCSEFSSVGCGFVGANSWTQSAH